MYFSSFFLSLHVSFAALSRRRNYIIKHKISDGGQKTIRLFRYRMLWPDARQRRWELANNESCTYYLIMNFNKRATAAAARATATAAKCLMFDEMNFWPLKKIISTLWSSVWFLRLRLDGSWCRRFQSKQCSISGQPHIVIEDYFLVAVVGGRGRIISSQNTE